MNVCKRIVPLGHDGTQKAIEQALSCRWLRGKKNGKPLTTSKMFSLKIDMEPSQFSLPPVWCSKLRRTTGVHLALCRDEFHGPRPDTIRRVELETTTI
ncbi:hypothetical protein TNCV_3375861 [Trichonephila clavipes]|nr:hypothetical protein TNCV_3375861 [Trichonephila clavipes]